MLYLDNAATSKQKPKVFYKSMNKYIRELSVNSGHGGHDFSIKGTEKISETAEELASLFKIENPSRIAFSHNATMSLNQAITGLLKKGGHAVVTQMEHNSVLRPVHALGNYTVAKADGLGRVDPESIKKAMKSDTKLVVCTHASNVCGTIEEIAKIGKIAHENGSLFLLDAAQTVGVCGIDVEKMNVDMLAFSAHKGLMGPMGVGGLYVKEGITLEPIISGGTGTQSKMLSQPSEMPELLVAGTQNTPAIAALKESIKFIKKITPEQIGKYQTELAFELIQRLKNMNGVKVYGICSEKEGKRNGTVLFNIDGMESGEVSEILNNDFKIAVRGGWHCAYYAHCALGSEKTGGVRASFGFFSNKKDVGVLADAVYKIAKEHK